MIHTLEEFFRSFDAQTESTRRLLAVLTDDSLAQAVSAGRRTLGGMAWHIITSMPEIMVRTGLPMSAIDPESLPPSAADEIRRGYDTVTTELEATIRHHWTDADLAATDNMYGETWPRGLTLRILLDHEIHHRGQMTVLMRQAGLPVPGIYGPSKEEWDQIGKPAPPY